MSEAPVEFRSKIEAQAWQEGQEASLGYAPPVHYDMSVDRLRPTTQADVDQLMAVAQSYGLLRTHIAEVHNELQGKLEALEHEKHGP
jgi:hypothetical protein